MRRIRRRELSATLVLLVEANAARATQVSLTRHNVKRMARLTRLTNDQLATALAGSGNIRQALIALGLAPGGANYETIRRRITEAHLNASLSERRGQSKIEASDDEIHNAVARSHSYAQALVALCLTPGGRIQSQFKKRVQSLGLDTSHFWGRGWRRGNSAPVVAPTRWTTSSLRGDSVTPTTSGGGFSLHGARRLAARSVAGPDGMTSQSRSSSTISMAGERTIG